MPAIRFAVPNVRLSRIRSRAPVVQRWAMFSPARWTTASLPSSAAAGAGSRDGSQRHGAALAAATQLDHLIAARPQGCGQPAADQPPAPVSATRMELILDRPASIRSRCQRCS
jgi:hypothetical protein